MGDTNKEGDDGRTGVDAEYIAMDSDGVKGVVMEDSSAMEKNLDVDRAALRDRYRVAFRGLWDNLEDPTLSLFKRLGYTTLSVLAEFGEGFDVISDQPEAREKLKMHLEEILRDRLELMAKRNMDMNRVLKQWGFTDEHAEEWLCEGKVEVDLWPGDIAGVFSALKSFCRLDKYRRADERRLESKVSKRLSAVKKTDPLTPSYSPQKSDNHLSDLAAKSQSEVVNMYTHKIRDMLTAMPQHPGAALVLSWLDEPAGVRVQVTTSTGGMKVIHVICKCGTRLRLFPTSKSPNVGALRRHLFGAGKERGSCKALKIFNSMMKSEKPS